MLVFCAHWPLPVRGSGRGHGVFALQPKAVRPSVRSVCLAIEALSVLQTKGPSLVGVFLTAATALLSVSPSQALTKTKVLQSKSWASHLLNWLP